MAREAVKHLALGFIRRKVADERALRRVPPKLFKLGLIVLHPRLPTYFVVRVSAREQPVSMQLRGRRAKIGTLSGQAGAASGGHPTEPDADSSDKLAYHPDMAAVIDGCIRQIEGDPPGGQGEHGFHAVAPSRWEKPPPPWKMAGLPGVKSAGLQLRMTAEATSVGLTDHSVQL